MTEADLEALRGAIQKLENTSYLMKAAGAIGAKVEYLIESLPDTVQEIVQDATRRTLEVCLKLALSSLGKSHSTNSFDFLHKASCTVSGALGGLFGMWALPIELPVSTAIILRSIAEIARSEGEDLEDTNVKLDCLSVLAFGARSKKDDDTDIGYFAVRAALAKALPSAADRTIPPALARFLAVIAERFGIIVSEKAVAEAVPILGAGGGGAINLVFINHFQDVAHGHFTVRRLERLYGPDIVREAYDRPNLR